MAQTKDKRFKEQKRAKKKPAPQPPVKTKKAAPAQSAEEGGGKKLLIGGGIVLALAAVITTVILVVNPFGAKTPQASSQPSSAASATPRPATTEMSAPLARITLIRDYRAAVDPEVAEQIAQTCSNGKATNATARIRGDETAITVTCKGMELKVVDAKTKKPLENRNASLAP